MGSVRRLGAEDLSVRMIEKHPPANERASTGHMPIFKDGGGRGTLVSLTAGQNKSRS